MASAPGSAQISFLALLLTFAVAAGVLLFIARWPAGEWVATGILGTAILVALIHNSARVAALESATLGRLAGR